MKRQTLVVSLMAGLVVCSLGAVAVSKTASHNDDGGPLRMFIRDEIGKIKTFYSDLDVTQEQREKIRDVLKEHRSEIVGVAKPIVEKRRALREAVLAKNPDDDAIRSAASSLGKAIGDAAVLASKIKPEVGKVLTTEQKEKIEEFRKQNDKAVDEFIEKIGSHS